MTALSGTSQVANISKPNYNYRFLDLIDIINNIDVEIINDLHQFDLIGDNLNLNNKDVKRIFYHHVVYSICQFIVNSQYPEKLIFIIDDKSFDRVDLSLYELIDSTKVSKFIISIFKRISNVLPINILLGECFRTLYHLFKSGGGEWLEEVSQLTSRLKDHDDFSFSKVKAFAKQYGLTFLMKEYFNNIKTKHILYK